MGSVDSSSLSSCIRERIEALSEGLGFEPDPSIILEEEIEDLIINIKVKLAAYGDNKVITKNIVKVCNKYFNTKYKGEFKSGIRTKKNERGRTNTMGS